MGRLANLLTDAWRRRRLTEPRIDVLVRCEARHEIPKSMPRHTLFVVGGPKNPKWAVFECPCGGGHEIMLSLVPTHPRHWRLLDRQDGPSLHPSVNYGHDGGRCHFWLADGRVRFTPDSTGARSRHMGLSGVA